VADPDFDREEFSELLDIKISDELEELEIARE
jgi:hypothetical protein